MKGRKILRSEVVLEALRDAVDTYGQLQFISPGGNGGDSLIDVGFFHLAENHGIPFRLTEPGDVDPSKPVVLSGGGGLVAEHPTSRTITLINMFRGVERLLILPQTITGHEDLLRSLGSNATIFARENRTARHLQENVVGGAAHALDHDMAFNVDVEKLYQDRYSLPRVSALKDVVRIGFCGIAAARSRTHRNINALRKDGEIRGNGAGRPLHNDLSMITAFRGGGKRNREATARIFLKLIDGYRDVTTDRLHIGIGAILLSKNVSLINNSNGKVHEVYAFSAAHLDNVKIVHA